MNTTTFSSIDEYIAQFPSDVQQLLVTMRKTIRKVAPSSKEVISYQMPTFKQEGNIVHFAAYKNHIGFYPAPSGIREFQGEINVYKNSKGAIQFPINEPLPIALIEKITTFRLNENLEKAMTKNKKTTGRVIVE